MGEQLKEKVWWNYIDHDLQELLLQSTGLIKSVEKWDEKFHDYAFIVFPAAKAYEGYLKKIFLDVGLITEEDFYGKRFRVGKALNPQLEKKYRKRFGVYDKLVTFCGGTMVADQLWETWKTARNSLFHWFPKERNAIDYKEAVVHVQLIINSMDLAFKGCKIDQSFDSKSGQV